MALTQHWNSETVCPYPLPNRHHDYVSTCEAKGGRAPQTIKQTPGRAENNQIGFPAEGAENNARPGQKTIKTAPKTIENVPKQSQNGLKQSKMAIPGARSAPGAPPKAAPLPFWIVLDHFGIVLDHF